VDSVYKAALFAGERELRELTKKRAELDQRINTLVQNVRALCGLLDDSDERIHHMRALEGLMATLKKPGLTKVIGKILYDWPDGLSAIEIRTALISSGAIDRNEYVNPTATIHTTLRRMIESGEVEGGTV